MLLKVSFIRYRRRADCEIGEVNTEPQALQSHTGSSCCRELARSRSKCQFFFLETHIFLEIPPPAPLGRGCSSCPAGSDSREGVWAPLAASGSNEGSWHGIISPSANIRQVRQTRNACMSPVTAAGSRCPARSSAQLARAHRRGCPSCLGDHSMP